MAKACIDCSHYIVCKQARLRHYKCDGCSAFEQYNSDTVCVVRCKDCKHYDNSEGIQWCKLNSKFYPGGFDWHNFPEDGFCSYGERKTDAESSD